jgi:hypothetical protein
LGWVKKGTGVSLARRLSEGNGVQQRLVCLFLS